jgi:hypothetical protein
LGLLVLKQLARPASSSEHGAGGKRFCPILLVKAERVMSKSSLNCFSPAIIALGLWLSATSVAFPQNTAAEQSRGPLVSVASLSGYIIQGTVNAERLEYLLQDSGSSKDHDSRLAQALATQNAAWSAILERVRSWKPTSQDVQQHVPQRLAELVSVAHTSLIESVSTIKKSPRYSWLAGRLASSLAKVNALQARLKQAIAPEGSGKQTAENRRQ